MVRKIFSVIIPHYNASNLLLRCLCSIPKRNDLEVIVVDDKSDEHEIDTITKIQHEFPNVHFIFLSENHGGGYARNIGLKYVQGKYVLFADADDFFNYCINDILDKYKDTDADIIFFNANSCDTNSYLCSNRAAQLNRYHKLYKTNPRKAQKLFKYLFGEPWCKMIKKSLIEDNKIQFDEISIHNDTKFSYLIGFYAKNISIDHRAIYCVTDRLGSVSKNISNEKLLIRTQVFAEANAFYKKNKIKIIDERAFRPMMYFLIKFKFKEVKICTTIFKTFGYSYVDLLLMVCFFPFLVIKKSITKLLEKL